MKAELVGPIFLLALVVLTQVRDFKRRGDLRRLTQRPLSQPTYSERVPSRKA